MLNSQEPKVIPAEAVEAAAKALWRRGRVDPWEDARDYITAEFREDALIALEAAAPYIRSQALLDAAHAAIDPTSEDMDKYFIDQSDTGLWLRERAAAERGSSGDD
jgi:hypothetical protein